MTQLAIRIIRFYQCTVSPDHGVLRGLWPAGVCRFSPTCSEYAAQSLRQHGRQGVGLVVRRLMRCHPFARGGVDSVPIQITRG